MARPKQYVTLILRRWDVKYLKRSPGGAPCRPVIWEAANAHTRTALSLKNLALSLSLNRTQGVYQHEHSASKVHQVPSIEVSSVFALQSFAGPFSKNSLDHKATPPQSQGKPPSAKNLSQVYSTNELFRFFELSSEIRNRVYYFSLPRDVIICGDKKGLRKYWRRARVLFSVSRQMRQESCQMVYVDSTIHISLEDFSSTGHISHGSTW